LNSLHGWRFDFKGWKAIASINVIWHVFSEQLGVITFHWLNGEGRDAKNFTYEVWKSSLVVLKHDAT
jgi:hypothetical protein